MSPRPPASPSTSEGSRLLRAEGLALGYRTPLLREVTLEVRAGERIAICGPNGAGKTTLFRGLLGLLEPLGGSLERESLRIGYVPQREQLDPLFPLTTLEVVLQGAVPALTGLRRHRSEAQAHAHALLERLGLAERGGTLLSQLSGGQRQRALLARALMVRPQLLLLDEPTSGVDLEAAAAVFEQVDRLAAEEGVAALTVTHQFDQLAQHVDTVWWVADGAVRTFPVEAFDPAPLLGRRSGDRSGGAT